MTRPGAAFLFGVERIAATTRTNDLYAWTGHGTGTTATVANGLNQLSSIGGAVATYDSKGNLTADPTSGRGYAYSSENLLTSAGGATTATLAYDPLLRLRQVTGTATTQFAYDGLAMIAEYDGAGTLLRRYVHGPGSDEPLVQYEGPTTTDRRWLHADERGSIVAISDGGGNALTINRYDEYGKPQATNAGRFGYTGQMWLGEVGLNYYKARMYAPQLGRFLQTDPIGTNGGINLYAYVGNDSVNGADSMGLALDWGISTHNPAVKPINPGEIVVTATRPPRCEACQGQSIDSFAYADIIRGLNDRVSFSIPTYVDSKTGDIVVTATKPVSKSVRWILVYDHYVQNPNYVQPWWDFGLDGFMEVQMAGFAAVDALAAAPIASEAMAGSRTFGVASSRFGNNYYRGGAGQGSWNYGSARLGWSFNRSTGNIYFQLRIGNFHVPTPFFTPGF